MAKFEAFKSLVEPSKLELEVAGSCSGRTSARRSQMELWRPIHVAHRDVPEEECSFILRRENK